MQLQYIFLSLRFSVLHPPDPIPTIRALCYLTSPTMEGSQQRGHPLTVVAKIGKYRDLSTSKAQGDASNRTLRDIIQSNVLEGF